MTESQESKCHVIIHGHAVACGAGNLVPLPGLGCSVDIATMVTMCMCLAAVFGGNITEEVAKGLAIAALKRTLLKHPVKVVTKEFVKLIPGLGQLVAPALSVVMIEAAGWSMAKDLEQRAASQREATGVD